jgi:hypothetical protein
MHKMENAVSVKKLFIMPKDLILTGLRVFHSMGALWKTRSLSKHLYFVKSGNTEFVHSLSNGTDH